MWEENLCGVLSRLFCGMAAPPPAARRPAGSLALYALPEICFPNPGRSRGTEFDDAGGPGPDAAAQRRPPRHRRAAARPGHHPGYYHRPGAGPEGSHYPGPAARPAHRPPHVWAAGRAAHQPRRRAEPRRGGYYPRQPYPGRGWQSYPRRRGQPYARRPR